MPLPTKQVRFYLLIDNIHSVCTEGSISLLWADIDGPTLKMHQFNVYLYLCVSLYVYICVCFGVCMSVYIYIYVCVCACVCVCVPPV